MRLDRTDFVDYRQLARIVCNRPKLVESYARGRVAVERWLDENDIPHPGFVVTDDPIWFVPGCAGTYHNFRRRVVAVDISRCILRGRFRGLPCWEGGMDDLSPYGVLCHEIGHHVDRTLGTRRGSRWQCADTVWREIVEEEEAISCLEPDVLESFAEAVRLFITNNELLKVGRPVRWEYLTSRLGLTPPSQVEQRPSHRIVDHIDRWIRRGRDDPGDSP